MGYKEDIARIKTGIDKLADKTLAETSLEVQRQVSQQTPVGNPDIWAANRGLKRGDKRFSAPKGYTGGRARSNWFMSVGQAATQKTDDTTGSNLEQGKAVSQTVKGRDEVHITNNLPYIERLNEGYSTQAPANFVQTAALAARAKIEEIAKGGLPK